MNEGSSLPHQYIFNSTIYHYCIFFQAQLPLLTDRASLVEQRARTFDVLVLKSIKEEDGFDFA